MVVLLGGVVGMESLPYMELQDTVRELVLDRIPRSPRRSWGGGIAGETEISPVYSKVFMLHLVQAQIQTSIARCNIKCYIPKTSKDKEKVGTQIANYASAARSRSRSR